MTIRYPPSKIYKQPKISRQAMLWLLIKQPTLWCIGSLDKQARGGRCLVQPMTATTRLTTEARSLYGH
uniref:Uncharacterized protein n=1 Tax=Aegilops tauschii subsp. strangulata TaxID=200361 RepID=A0A453I414_AEGTS